MNSANKKPYSICNIYGNWFLYTNVFTECVFTNCVHVFLLCLLTQNASKTFYIIIFCFNQAIDGINSFTGSVSPVSLLKITSSKMHSSQIFISQNGYSYTLYNTRDSYYEVQVPMSKKS